MYETYAIKAAPPKINPFFHVGLKGHSHSGIYSNFGGVLVFKETLGSINASDTATALPATELPATALPMGFILL